MADKSSLADFEGALTNLDEPKPGWNDPLTIILISSVALGCSTACVLLRLYVRLFVTRAPGWDDLLIGFYALTGISGGVCLCLAPKWGLGQHFLLLAPDDMEKYLKVFYVANASYNTSTALIKLSLLFQYLRLFERGWLRWICISLISSTALWGVTYCFMAWFPCFPVNHYWKLIPGNTCYAYASLDPDVFFATYSSHSTLNMALDIAVFVVPLPLFWRKNTQRRTKLGLIGLIVAGAMVVGISLWRLDTVLEHRAATKPTFDPTWYSPVSLILGVLEVNLAAICASVPVFWPVVSACIDQIWVTHEVKITRTHRISVECGDRIELHSIASNTDAGTPVDHWYSREGSEGGLRRSASVDRDEKKGHYMDDFIAAQVDPLSEESPYTVESEIFAERLKKPKSKSYRFYPMA
ncbi:hypothetical protein GGR56DRAFT_694207 [Xylariaceae sp. FL0804]|nr:hypothetical protein GGR56DRAFT_694207 [Xylariaceae sp. FL0804]